jgi:hypothetical protein
MKHRNYERELQNHFSRPLESNKKAVRVRKLPGRWCAELCGTSAYARIFAADRDQLHGVAKILEDWIYKFPKYRDRDRD